MDEHSFNFDEVLKRLSSLSEVGKELKLTIDTRDDLIGVVEDTFTHSDHCDGYLDAFIHCGFKGLANMTDYEVFDCLVNNLQLEEYPENFDNLENLEDIDVPSGFQAKLVAELKQFIDVKCNEAILS